MIRRRALLLLFPALLSAQGPPVSESVNVRVMDIDVVVTDREGRPVSDLRKDEFHLRVDKKTLAVDYFAAVQDSAIRSPGQRALSPDLVLKQAKETADSIPRHFLIFFDANVSAGGRLRSGEALKTLVARLGPADEASVLAEGGLRTESLCDWTSDKETLLAALDSAEKPRPETRDLARRPDEQETSREVSRMVADLNDSLSLFGGKPGKKVFLDISGGLETEPAVSAGIRHVAERANAMEITLFGIETGDREATPGGLALLAEETGGRAFPGQNRIGSALEGILRDASSYYSLGVDLKSISSEGTHRIDVAIDRAGLVVRARKTYTVESEDQRIENRVIATLLSDTSYADISVSLRIEPAAIEKSISVLPVRIEVPARDLTFLPDGDRASARVAFYFTAVNDRGDRTGISRSEQTLTVPLTESRSSRPVRVRIPARLPKGNYRIVVNVRDVETGRMGTARASARVE